MQTLIAKPEAGQSISLFRFLFSQLPAAAAVNLPPKSAAER